MSRITIEINASKPAAGHLLAVYLQGVLDQDGVSAVIDTPGHGRPVPPELAASIGRHKLVDMVGRGTRVSIRCVAAAGGGGTTEQSRLVAAARNFASERGLDGDQRPTLDDLLDFLDCVGEAPMESIVIAMGADRGAVGELIQLAAAYLRARPSDRRVQTSYYQTLYRRAHSTDKGPTHGNG